MIRYHARYVFPITRPPIENGTVGVRDGRIAYVGERAAAPRGDDVDLGDAALVPGLINAHTHLELTAMRGFLEDLPFSEWIARLQRAKRAVLDEPAMLDSARLGIVEGLRAGVTTFADTCDSGLSLRAMREHAVRGVMFQEVFGPDPSRCADALADLRAKVETLRPLVTPLQRLGVSPHAAYTVSDALFAAVGAFAREAGLPLAVHLAESESESLYVRNGVGPFADALRARGIPVAPRGRTPVALLERLGLLEARPLLVHCVHVDEADVAAIATAGCAVAHCPVSNAKLGHGVAPLLELLDARVAVGLGSDSMASNNRMDILEEARMAALAQRVRVRRPDALSAAAALELATLGGARALGIADQVGSLEPGKEADLAAFDLRSPHAIPVHDPAATLIHAADGCAATFVIVAGRVLVRDRQVVDEDPGLVGRVRRTAERLAAWRQCEGADG
jgi:cytosine/adenosine deaminase-related metal-dependent hydrolase